MNRSDAATAHEELLLDHFDNLLNERSRLRAAAQQAAEEGDPDLLTALADELEDTQIAIDCHRARIVDLF